jgi:hypothetical protein
VAAGDFLFSKPLQTGADSHPICSTIRTEGLFWGQSRWGLAFTSHQYLAPSFITVYCYNSTPPSVLPLENYEVTFTFTFTYFKLSSISDPKTFPTIYSIDVENSKYFQNHFFL